MHSKPNNKFKEHYADDLYFYIKAKNSRQDLLFSWDVIDPAARPTGPDQPDLPGRPFYTYKIGHCLPCRGQHPPHFYKLSVWPACPAQTSFAAWLGCSSKGSRADKAAQYLNIKPINLLETTMSTFFRNVMLSSPNRILNSEETESSVNQGNYLELLCLQSKDNSLLSKIKDWSSCWTVARRKNSKWEAEHNLWSFSVSRANTN